MSRSRKALLVASTGGHLEQLSRLRRGFMPAFDSVEFATFDDQQSRSLLAGERVHYVPYIPPRGVAPAIRAEAPALRIIRSGGFTDVVSTGSAIAVPFLTAARMLRVRSHYIESAARSEGPSLSGEIVSKLPGVHLYSQYPVWAEDRWQFRGSVFDRFALATEERTVTDVRRVVVTLGTMRRYQFRRAVTAVQSALADIAGPETEVLWQVGATDVSGLGIDAQTFVPAETLQRAIRRADLVVAHAGIGSCLQILDAGRAPVLLPRRAEHGEHIDDHQRMIAFELHRRGLGVSREPSELTADDLRTAMSRQVVIDPDPTPFRLQGLGRLAWREVESPAPTIVEPRETVSISA